MNVIARQTAWVLNLFQEGSPYHHETVEHYHNLGDGGTEQFKGSSAWVYFNSKKILLIVPNCNALELMVLFAGFIICYPSSKRSKWIWIPSGIIAIYLINVLRCVG